MSYDIGIALTRLEKAWEDHSRDCLVASRIPPLRDGTETPDRTTRDYQGLLYHHLRGHCFSLDSRHSTNVADLRICWEVSQFADNETRHVLSLLASGPVAIDDALVAASAGASLIRQEDRGVMWYTFLDDDGPEDDRRFAAMITA